jgi:ABC-type lipoprotein release transport system permease subunit
MFKLWKIAFRDLTRHRRRTILTLIAVALGIALLVVTSGVIAGMTDGAVGNGIRLQTGHVQVRAASYDEDRLGLSREELLSDPQAQATRALSIKGVQVATPLLWVNANLGLHDQSVNVRVFGIDPSSRAFEPIRENVVAGRFLLLDDTHSILIGQRLADQLDLNVGQEISLLASTADGDPNEMTFTICGLYDNGIPTFDESTVYLPITSLQTLTHTDGRASTLLILLNSKNKADQAAAALQAPGLKTLTWRDLNAEILSAMEATLGFVYMIYLIVLAVVAVVIANTLLMATFERTREIGILAALGMKRRQILATFLLEAAMLGFIGVLIGDLLGAVGVLYLAEAGWHIGETASITTTEVVYSTTIYGSFSPSATLGLSVAGLTIILLASIYPAWLGSRMEPVSALRAQ